MSTMKMRTPDAAAYILKSTSWLNKSRQTRTGPAFLRLGGTIVYDAIDLDAWMAANRVGANDNERARAAA
jgi:hypothetical protein